MYKPGTVVTSNSCVVYLWHLYKRRESPTKFVALNTAHTVQHLPRLSIRAAAKHYVVKSQTYKNKIKPNKM